MARSIEEKREANKARCAAWVAIPENRKRNLNRAKAWAQDNRERKNRTTLAALRRRKYGVVQEQIEGVLLWQNGACAICEKPFTQTPCVDHCHNTGEFRGLLCRKCNSGLGQFSDDLKRLEAAVRYLRESLTGYSCSLDPQPPVAA